MVWELSHFPNTITKNVPSELNYCNVNGTVGVFPVWDKYLNLGWNVTIAVDARFISSMSSINIF